MRTQLVSYLHLRRNSLGRPTLLAPIVAIAAACSSGPTGTSPMAGAESETEAPGASLAPGAFRQVGSELRNARPVGGSRGADTDAMGSVGNNTCNYTSSTTLPYLQKPSTGLVLTGNVAINEIDWDGYSDSNAVALTQSLATALSEETTPYLSWLHSEYGIGTVSQGTEISIVPQYQCDEAVCVLGDSDIQKELTYQYQNHKIPGGFSNLNVVELPLFINVNAGGGPLCNGGYRAYHSGFSAPDGTPILYAVIPSFWNNSCATNGLGAWANTFTTAWEMNFQSAVSHEIIETMTDPNGSGYHDVNGCNEIGDICNEENATIFGATVGPVTVQKMWSNALSECVTGDDSPVITGVTVMGSSTASARADQDQQVTVTGERLLPGASFAFGNDQATNVQCTSAGTSCTLTLPPNTIAGDTPQYPGANYSSFEVVPVVATNGLGYTSSWDSPNDSYAFLANPGCTGSWWCQETPPAWTGETSISCPMLPIVGATPVVLQQENGGYTQVASTTGSSAVPSQTNIVNVTEGSTTAGSDTFEVQNTYTVQGTAMATPVMVTSDPVTVSTSACVCPASKSGCGEIKCGTTIDYCTGATLTCGAPCPPPPTCTTPAQCCVLHHGTWNGKYCL